MGIEVVTRTEFDEWCKKVDAQIQKATQMVQGGEQIIYDNEALSQKLKVSKRTLQNWRDEGLIDYTQIGHKIFYTEEAIRTTMEKFKKGAFRTIQ